MKRNQRVVVPRDKLGFPTSMISTLRYTQRIEFNPSSTQTVAWTFRANDLFDPFAATGGHQPRGFDEMMDIYNQFTVTSSKIMVNWMYEGYSGPSTTDSTGHLVQSVEALEDAPAVSPVFCGIMRSADGYGSSIDVEQQLEKDRTSWVVLTPTTGAKVTSAKSQLSDFFGKQDLVAADGYSGTDMSSPSNQAFYHIWAGRGSDDYPADTSKIVAYCTIEYRATFTEPKPLQAS